jgi:hypothetical protein
MVLVADCGLHHMIRAREGEWWLLGEKARTGLGLRLADTLCNTIVWLVNHACPVLCLRHPDWVGPHCMARIVVCSLFEGAFVTAAALVLPTDVSTSAASQMAWRMCLPALCVTLMALATFFVAMEPQYRRTFFVRDTRGAMHRRHWDVWAEGIHGEEDRALLTASGDFLRYVGEPVVVWIEHCSPRWAQSPPAWCTAEWRATVLEHAQRLLPGDGSVRVAAAMRSMTESERAGNGARDEELGSSAARADEEWDLSSPLVV